MPLQSNLSFYQTVLCFWAVCPKTARSVIIFMVATEILYKFYSNYKIILLFCQEFFIFSGNFKQEMNKNTIFEKMIINFNSGIKTGSQTYFAKMLNIPVQTISAWVNGRSIPTAENIVQLAKIFDKSEEEIKKIFVRNTTEITNAENRNINS